MRAKIFCLWLLSSSLVLGDDSKIVAEMNDRIDKLEITSDEIVVRAESMNQLELVVETMEKKQAERLVKVKEREAAAKKRIIELDTEFDQIEKRVKQMEAESKRINTANEKRLNQLRQGLGDTIEANVGESRVVLVEKLIKKVKELMNENAQLKAKLAKPKAK